MIKSRYRVKAPTLTMSFVRPNLTYSVRMVDVRNGEDKQEALLYLLKHTEGSAIVYTRSRKLTEELAHVLVGERSWKRAAAVETELKFFIHVAQHSSRPQGPMPPMRPAS